MLLIAERSLTARDDSISSKPKGSAPLEKSQRKLDSRIRLQKPLAQKMPKPTRIEHEWVGEKRPVAFIVAWLLTTLMTVKGNQRSFHVTCLVRKKGPHQEWTRPVLLSAISPGVWGKSHPHPEKDN